ncbi:hypothetical protein [Leptothoe sp. PORK10 BA2]|uniref:hypothetical protein n=1 Tax=Leptothoe sp. PORK10 BA2 TaxID=3110254 RepID=UPI002B21F202|nr:hypothetical protein [Leptothoe sp. PORK10 BA2]MEA5463419.1 hypothetical protein [Leptothoe sp. PORK10 BA2]
MSERNNNQGHNPIWADNSDRKFQVNTLLADLPKEPSKTTADDEAYSQTITAKQILAKILQEIVQASKNAIQRLTGRGHL